MRFGYLAPFLLSSLTAQVMVLPGHFTRTEGNSFSSDGFGALTLARHLQLHDGVAARTVRSVALRRDGDSFNRDQHGPGVVLLDLFVSTGIANGGQPNPNFDANHGTNRMQALAGAPVNYPPSGGGPLARPFLFRLPFATPFSFNGGTLCWEMRVVGRTNQSLIWLDACANWDSNPAAITWSTDPGCVHSQQTQPMTLTGNSNPNWPTSVQMTFTGSQGPRSGTVSLAFGIRADDWGGLPLPFTLPGTETAPSGACRLYNDQLLLLNQTTDASGGFSLSLPLPVNIGLNGLSVFTQFFARDLPANGWGIVVSNGLQQHLVAPWTNAPLGQVFAPTMMPTGTALPYQGQIIEID